MDERYLGCSPMPPIPPPATLLRQIGDDCERLARTIPNHLCPSLVMITVCDEKDGRLRGDSLGFVFRNDAEYAYVVAMANCLYESNPDRLCIDPKKAKIVVARADRPIRAKSGIQESDIATVVSVDLQLGLLLLKFKGRYHIDAGEVGSFDTILQFPSKKFICLDLYSTYDLTPDFYKLVPTDGDGECTYGHEGKQRCGYFHTYCWFPKLEALILDFNGLIVGFKVGGCKANDLLSHIMPIAHCQDFINAGMHYMNSKTYKLQSNSIYVAAIQWLRLLFVSFLLFTFTFSVFEIWS